ncbi:ParB/RepB/Spo0J family partition protein [Methylomagnum sp.]
MNRKDRLKASSLAGLASTRSEISESQAQPCFSDGLYEKISVDNIDRNPWQPRKKISDLEIEALAKSISEAGQIEPIIVRKKGGRYELIAGERRWLATKSLNRSHIEAIIREADDSQVALLALIENMQRQDLSDYEIGMGIAAAEKKFRFKKEISESLGIGRTDLYRYLAFSELPEWIISELEEAPSLISKRLAEEIRNFLKDKNPDDYHENIMRGLRSLEDGTLQNKDFIGAITRLRPPRITGFAQSKPMSLEFKHDGQVVGGFKYSPERGLSLKLSGSILDEARVKSIEEFVQGIIHGSASA